MKKLGYFSSLVALVATSLMLVGCGCCDSCNDCCPQPRCCARPCCKPCRPCCPQPCCPQAPYGY